MGTKFIKNTSLVLLMLITGVFWGTWFTLTRSIGEFSSTEFIHIGKVIIANVANPMKILMPASILFLGWTTWMEYRKKNRSFYPLPISFLLLIISLWITLSVEVPIDNQIKTWTAMNLPDDWEAIRQKWAWYHELRTITSVASIALFSVAVVH